MTLLNDGDLNGLYKLGLDLFYKEKERYDSIWSKFWLMSIICYVSRLSF